MMTGGTRILGNPYVSLEGVEETSSGLTLSSEDGRVFLSPVKCPRCLWSRFPFLDLISRRAQLTEMICLYLFAQSFDWFDWAFEVSGCIKSPWSVAGKYDVPLISFADHFWSLLTNPAGDVAMFSDSDSFKSGQLVGSSIFQLSFLPVFVIGFCPTCQVRVSRF